MKNYLNVTLATILMAVTVSAQHVNIGIKAGLNIYNISSDDNSAYDSKVGFNLGLLGHMHLTEHLAIQPEILYSGQGAKFTSAGVDYKSNLSYINIPVLFQYMFDNGFRIEAGPQLGILISAKSKANDVETDIKDQVKSIDFGLGVGVSYVHPTSGFGVDARYNLGLSNINETGTINSKNRGIKIGVFYIFNHN